MSASSPPQPDVERVSVSAGDVTVDYPSPIYGTPPDPKLPPNYGPGTGADRFARLIWDYLGVRLTPEQRIVLRSVEQNKRTLVYGANGFGKTYLAATLTHAWQTAHYQAITFATSGTYKKMRRTFCKDVEELHDNAFNGNGLPGRYKHANPRIEIDDEPNHFFEADKPADAGELEGIHTDYLLAIIEEADKSAVTPELVDSMESLITDDRDRMLVLANPPEEETNIVNHLIDNPGWNEIQFSSFDAHNVKIELGERRGPADGDAYLPPVSGLATVSKIRDDWLSFNNEPWPGAQAARTAHEERDDLDPRWLRRRIGIIPSETSSVNRPFTTGMVDDVFDARGTLPSPDTTRVLGIALDVARKGGDQNVLSARTPTHIAILDRWTGLDHVENEERVKRNIQTAPDENPYVDAIQRDLPPFAVDATPEGSGLADRIGTFYSELYRFNNGEKAFHEREYKNKWSEGLGLLGRVFREGITVTDQRLREELLAAARTVEFKERYYESRDAEVYYATKKDKVADALGRSPDCLDSALMANLVAERRDELEPDEDESDFYGIISQ